MDFTVKIELGNEAMEDGTHVADALDKIGHHLRGTVLVAGNEGIIRDGNGNRVGTWVTTDA